MFARSYLGDDLTRSEDPSSKLRRAMRKQMRDDARRMVVTPKVKRERPLPRSIDDPPLGRCKCCPHMPDDLYMPKNWYLA